MDKDGDGSGTGGRAERLETFKRHRDLTLGRGGLLRPRRNYVPNIPPKRHRPGPANNQSKPGPSSLFKRPSPNLAAPENRGRGGKAKQALVQSGSIFSEGVGEGTVTGKASQSTGGVGGSGGFGEDHGRVGQERGADLEPIIKRRLNEGTFKITDVTDDDEEIGGSGNFISDLEIVASLQPISLPLSRYLPPGLPNISLTTVDPETKNKSEFDGPVTPVSFPGSSFANALLAAPPEGTIVFFQLPVKLPVLEPTPTTTNIHTQDSLVKKEKDPKLSSDISVLPEGYIGKVQILASGRSRLLIGDNAFEIEPGKAVAFREELAAIDLERNKLTVLGPIKHRFQVVPYGQQQFASGAQQPYMPGTQQHCVSGAQQTFVPGGNEPRGPGFMGGSKNPGFVQAAQQQQPFPDQQYRHE